MPPKKKKQRTAADSETAKKQTAKKGAEADVETASKEKAATPKQPAATNGASANAATGSSDEVTEGALICCTELACLFNAVEDEEYEKEVPPGETFVVAGKCRNCGDYIMAPVRPPNSSDGTAVQWVQLDLFKVITPGPPAAASSSQAAGESAPPESEATVETMAVDEAAAGTEQSAAEKAAAEKAAAEKAAAEKASAEKAAAEKAAAEKAAAEKAAAEKAAAEKAAAENAAAEKAAAQKEAAEKLAAEKEQAEKVAAEKAMAERAAAEKEAAEKEAAAKTDVAETPAAETAEAEKVAAEKASSEPEVAEKAEAETAETAEAAAETAAATEEHNQAEEADYGDREEGHAETGTQNDNAQKSRDEAEAEKMMQEAFLKTRQSEDSGMNGKDSETEMKQETEAEKRQQDEAAEKSEEQDVESRARNLKRKFEEMQQDAAPNADSSSASSSEPAPGKRVKLHSLVSAPDLNGQFAVLTELNASNGRWECQLLSNPERKVSMKPEKFVILPDEEADRERSRSRDRADAFDPEAPPPEAGTASSAGTAGAPEVCTACGSNLTPDALFCRKCGTKCAGRASAPEAESTAGEEQRAEGTGAGGTGTGDDRPPGDNRPPPERLSENHYEALCLTVRASESDIKKAYHLQSKKHHPDKNPGDANATQRFQRIMEAYKILTDRPKRAEYDGGLILKEVLGEQRYDQRTHQWVVRNRAAGRDVQSMRLDPQSAQRLLAANHANHGAYFRNIMQTTGCDILVLDRMSPCVILLGVLPGQPQDGQNAKSVIEGTLAELEGMRAPRDGVVMVVPQDQTTYMRMQQASQLFQGLYMNLRVVARVATANRIVLQGGHSVPQAVVQIQSPLGWLAKVLMPNGQSLDPWTWAHHIEFTGTATPAAGRPGDQFKYLCPPQDPMDAAIIRKQLCVGLSINEEDAKEESLVELAIRVLENHAKGRRITCAMMRACTSIAVHAEHAALPPQAQLPLLFALIDIFPVYGAAVAARFQSTPTFKALQQLLELFRHSSECVTLRVRCWRVLCDLIPEDGEWHPWEEVLNPDGPLLEFWKDLGRWMDDEKPPPLEWFQLLRIMYPILSTCVTRPGECDEKEGIRRPIPAEEEEGADKKEEDSSKQAAAATLEAQGDEAERLTLLENIEEVLATLASGTEKSFSPKISWVPMAQVIEEAQKLDIKDEEGEIQVEIDMVETITTEWFDSHRSSFEITKYQQKDGEEEWKVRLVQAAHIRASSRLYERACGPLRESELTIADEVLPKLSGGQDSLPRSLRPFELAALLCLVSRNQHLLSSGQFPFDSLLRRFSRLPAKDMLHQIYPFSPAMLMRAIVTLAKKKTSWNKEALDVLLQAAALNMHVVEKRVSENPVDRPPATLAQSATALWAAAQHPFSERLNEHLRKGEPNKTPIVQSATLRLQLEVAQQASMSTEGSAFRHFAQMCAWLAHVTVISSLTSEMKVDVLNAFKRLGEVCQRLGEQPETAPCDPEGLCRLAMAVALVGRDEKKQEGSDSTRRALEGLARVVVEKAMDEAFDWRPQQLAVLASAYSAAEVPHEGLFDKISEAAERHAMLGNEWSTDQLMKLLNSAQELGQLKTMDKLLRSLDLNQYVKEATPKNLPLLFHVIVTLENMDMLEELMESKKGLISQTHLQGLLTMLKVWPPQDANTPALTSMRQLLVRECLALAARRMPSPSELQSIVEAIKEDPKAQQRLAELAASPALVASVPLSDSLSWSDLQKSIVTILGPFVKAGVEAPRLEAACAARLLTALEKFSADSRQDARDFAPAILELSESALLGMPVVVETIADRLRAKLPRGGAASNSSYNCVRDLLQRLASVVVQYPRRTSGDNELDGWVERFERTVLDDTRSLRLESVEHLFSKRMPGQVREALGPAFITILLVRSRKLAWNGGRSLQADPPQPRNAVKKLADASVQMDPSAREKLIGLEIENSQASRQPTRAQTGFGARDRSRSRDGRNRDSGRGGPTPSRFSQTPPPPSSAASTPLPPDRRPPPYGNAPSREPYGAAPSAGGPSGSRPSYATPADRGPPGRPQPPVGSAYANRYGTPVQPSSRDQPARVESDSARALARAHPDAALIVDGCRDKAMAETLQGAYKMWGMNQNRPVFQRIRDSDRNEQPVLLYYWDDRDGPDQMGWWFGPEVGGEEVWAHRAVVSAQGRDVVPPETGWRMLHNQTEDVDMRVIAQARSHAPSVAPSAKGGIPTRRDVPPLRPERLTPAPPRPRGTAGYGGMQAPHAPSPPARPPPPSMAANRQASIQPPLRPAMGSQQARPGPAPAYGSRVPWGGQPQPQVQASSNLAQQKKRESDLHAWLKKLDNGQGQLLQYYDVLAREFDADLSMIAAVKVDGGERRGGLIGCVDPSFWETVKVSKMGHRMLFAKGISQLPP